MSDTAYRVLARKYRPVDFDGLIGQEVLVRTLSNAISVGRLAQAYILTGVRGVGKTTTARILARAFNCVGPDGQGGPTVKPCGVCDHCKAIAEDRHVDVVEMDAASNNSVDNIREIVDASRYRPASARYKVYILDEVHMLSNAAFNALLKTLEEPPAHLKFIFATTEIRKVPVTVLSRCQRFDLRRVEAAELATHLQGIAEREEVTVEAEALNLLARAADGSVRDGLSLLDQSLAFSEDTVTEAHIRDMLGLADRGVLFDMMDALLDGNVQECTAISTRMHAAGADSAVILNDLLELTHWLTRLKVDPNASTDFLMPEAERARGASMAEELTLPLLARLWQLLLKGVAELPQAPSPQLALEMVLIRAAYAAELPVPADLVRQLRQQTSGAEDTTRKSEPPLAEPRPIGAMPVAATPPSAPPPQHPAVLQPPAGETRAEEDAPGFEPLTAAEPPPTDEMSADPAEDFLEQLPVPGSFREFVGLLENRRIEPLLTAQLRNQVRPVSFAPGAIEIALQPGAERTLTGNLRTVLQRLFGGEWRVAEAASSDTPTVQEMEAAEKAAEQEEALTHPLVQAALQAFPGATVGEVRVRPLEAPDDWTRLVPPADNESTFEDEDQ